MNGAPNIPLVAFFLSLLLSLQALGQGMMMTPAERAQFLKERLSLSDAQTAKVQVIYEEAQNEYGPMMEKRRGDRDAMLRLMMEMYGKSDKKVEALLTPEQKKKYEEAKREQRDQLRKRMQERRQQP